MIVNLLIPGEDFRWIEDRFRDIQKDINRLEIDRVNNKDWLTNNQNISGHKHDNYQSQIDTMSRRIEDLAQALNNRINRHHQEYMKTLEEQHSFNKAVNKDINNLNPITLNPDTVTNRLNELDERMKIHYKVENRIEKRLDKIEFISGKLEHFDKRVDKLKQEINTIQHYHIDNDISIRIDELEKIAGKLKDFRGLKAKVNTVLNNSWDTYYLDKKTLDDKFSKLEKRVNNVEIYTIQSDNCKYHPVVLRGKIDNLHSLHRKFKNEVELSLESMNNKVIDLGDFNLINTEDETEELSQIEAEIKGETIVKQLKDDSDVQKFMRQQEIDFHRETNLVTDKIEKQAEIDYVSGIDD